MEPQRPQLCRPRWSITAAVWAVPVARIALDGEAVVAASPGSVRSCTEPLLWPDDTLALALALQELATNAVKHGALSNPAGEVRVLWEMASYT